MPTTDPTKRREYARASYKRRMQDPAYKAKLLAANHKRKAVVIAENKRIIDTFRADGCSMCDESDPCCLQAHHQDPSQKEFTIGEASGMGYSATAIQRELDKCICVCANCHFKIHAS